VPQARPPVPVVCITCLSPAPAPAPAATAHRHRPSPTMRHALCHAAPGPCATRHAATHRPSYIDRYAVRSPSSVVARCADATPPHIPHRVESRVDCRPARPISTTDHHRPSQRSATCDMPPAVTSSDHSHQPAVVMQQDVALLHLRCSILGVASLV
jgi:hypothetical protein